MMQNGKFHFNHRTLRLFTTLPTISSFTSHRLFLNDMLDGLVLFLYFFQALDLIIS